MSMVSIAMYVLQSSKGDQFVWKYIEQDDILPRANLGPRDKIDIWV